MNKNEVILIKDEFLNLHNKIQEAIQLYRDGKWYRADTRMAGIKQRALNMYIKIENIIQNDFQDNNDENNKNI
jgi:hypothetical protein